MALTNCTITSTTVDVTKNQAVGTTASQVLIITPDVGYVVRAADFTKQSPPTGIDTITLADSTTAYALDNTVTVTCDLTNSYNPGNNDVTLTIDIDGDAILSKQEPLTVSGSITNTLTNATVNTATQPYSASGVEGTTATVFTRTYTAGNGKYFIDEPSYVISSNNSSNYKITSTTTESNGLVTAKVFTVEYIFDQSSTGDTITFTANAAGTIPVAGNKKINSYVHDQSALSFARTKRALTIYGDVGAQVKLTMTRGDGTKYNFTNGNFSGGADVVITIDSSGKYTTMVDYPAISGADTYTFTLNSTAYGGTDLSTSIDPNSDGVGTFTVAALANVTYTVATNSASGRSYTSSPSQAYTGTVNQEVADSLVSKTISLVLTDDVSMALRRLPTESDFVAVNCDGETGDSEMTIKSITSSGTAYVPASNNVYSSLTFTVNVDLESFGEAVSTHTLALDNFINLPPVATSHQYNTNEDTNVVIDLSGKATDANSDSLTYSIVGNPANASVNLSGSNVTFSPNANWNGTTTFTWKCNDGYQDSNTATATVVVAAVADAPTNITMSSQTINENNSINAVVGTFSSVDPDGSGTYTYTLVSGTGSTDNSSFNISGSSLRASAVFDYETKNSYSIRVRSTDADGSGYTEKQFTISIGNVVEATTWEITMYNSSGNATGAVHYANSTQFCDGGSLASMPGGCFGVNKYIRMVTIGDGCGGTVFGGGKITNVSSENTATVYVYGDMWYNTASDSINNQNATGC